MAQIKDSRKLEITKALRKCLAKQHNVDFIESYDEYVIYKTTIDDWQKSAFMQFLFSRPNKSFHTIGRFSLYCTDKHFLEAVYIYGNDAPEMIQLLDDLEKEIPNILDGVTPTRISEHPLNGVRGYYTCNGW